MKIIYFNYLYDVKYSSVGAAAHVKQITAALRRLGNEVVSHNLNKYQSVEESINSPVRAYFKTRTSYFLRPFNAIKANVRYFVKEWRYINEYKPDVILMRYNLLNISLPIIACLRKIPLVLEINGPVSYESKNFAKDAFHLPIFPELFERLSIFLASKVIVVSKELKSFYVQWGVYKEKIFVIPNGADINKFGLKVKGNLKYNFEGRKVIGFVGSFHYWHGIEDLYRIISSLAAEEKNVLFVLIGRGPLAEELKKKIEKNDLTKHVLFLGYISHEEIPNYLEAMDILVAPYPKMDFFYYSPLKLFEYMAAGKAVVAARIGQIKDIITDEVNGMLFEPEDVDDLLCKIKRLIQDERLRMAIGKNARETIKKKYSWGKTAEKVAMVCRSAIERQH